jgi:glutamate dehydrogenase
VAERGAAPAEVVRAYRIAREVTGAEADWEAIETLGGAIDPGAQVALMAGVDELVDAVTRWYLSDDPSGDLGETIAAGRAGFEQLAAAAPRLGHAERRAERAAISERLVEAGVPQGLAEAHALRPALVHAPSVVAVAGATGRPVEDVALAFFTVGDLLPLDSLEAELDTVPVGGRMQRWALQAVREDARRARREIAERALAATPSAGPEEAVSDYLGAHLEDCRRLEAFMRTLARERADMAGIALAVRQLRSLTE